jgi:hypothetical protein
MLINREIMFKLVLTNITNFILLSIISFLAKAFSSTYAENNKAIYSTHDHETLEH